MCICDYVKNHIGTFWNLCFDVKKGYKQIIVLDSPKTYCYQQSTLFLDITNCQSFKTKTSLKLEKLDNCRFDLRILTKNSCWLFKLHIGICKEASFFDKFQTYAPETQNFSNFQNVISKSTIETLEKGVKYALVFL